MTMESSPPRQTVMTYVDRPEIPETFADCLGRVTADAVHVRLEFCINRLDHLVEPNAIKTGKMITAARVVLTVPAMFGMLDQLNQIVEQLKAAGMSAPPMSTPPGLPPLLLN
jgi:hypothetical protein